MDNAQNDYSSTDNTGKIKKRYIPVLCPCIVAAIASKSTSKSELALPVGTPTGLAELTAGLFSDSPDPAKKIMTKITKKSIQAL